MELPPAAERRGAPAETGGYKAHHGPDGGHGGKGLAVFAQGQEQVLLAHFFQAGGFGKAVKKVLHFAGRQLLPVQGQIQAGKIPWPVHAAAGVLRVFFHIHHDAQLAVKALHPLQVAAYARDAPGQVDHLAALAFQKALSVLQVVGQVARLKPGPQQPDVGGYKAQRQSGGGKAKPAA